MAYTPTPKKYPKSSSASMQTGGKAKEGMPGVRGSGEAASRVGLGRAKPGNGKAKSATPDFKVGGSYRSGRTIQGATGTKARVSRAGAAREGGVIKKPSAAGRGKGGEMMGSNKSSSAQAGKYAPKKKASPVERNGASGKNVYSR